jgi:recombinational DNA repair protein RecT
MVRLAFIAPRSSRISHESVKKHSPWYEVTIDKDGTITTGNGFDQMALKTLIRKLAKRLLLSVELQTAVKLEDDADLGAPQGLESLAGQFMLPEAPTDLADDLGRRLEEARGEQQTIPGTNTETNPMPD